MLKKGIITFIITLLGISGVSYAVYSTFKAVHDEQETASEFLIEEEEAIDGAIDEKLMEETVENDQELKKEEIKKEKIEIEQKKEEIKKIEISKKKINKSSIKAVADKNEVTEIKEVKVEDSAIEEKLLEVAFVDELIRDNETELLELQEENLKKTYVVEEVLGKNEVQEEVENNVDLLESKNDLEEVSAIQLIEIMIEIGRYKEAKGLLDKLEEKDSYDYYFLSAMLANKQGKIGEAVDLYEKAFEKNVKNPVPRFRILSIYIKNSEYRKKTNKEIKFIDELEKSDEEKKEFENLKALLDKYRKRSVINASLGVVATDNVESVNTDKESDMNSLLALTYLNSINITEELSLNNYMSYYNKTYMDKDEKNSHSFFLGTEIEKKLTEWKLSLPLMFNYIIIDKEKASLGGSISTELSKNISKNLESIYSIGVKPTKNYYSDYDGNMYVLSSAFNWQKDENSEYSFELKGEQTDYSDESKNYSGLGLGLSLARNLRKNSLLKLGYALMYESYTDSEREDLIHDIEISLKGNLFKTKWSYLLSYSYEMDDANYVENEYVTNEFGIKFSRSF